MQSVKRTPEYQLQRIVTANEAPPFSAQIGANTANHRVACIQVVPCTELVPPADGVTLHAGTSNPVCEVYFWNDGLGLWIKHNPATTTAAMGAGVPFEFEVAVEGRKMLVVVTGGVTGGQGVAIYVGGYDNREES